MENTGKIEDSANVIALILAMYGVRFNMTNVTIYFHSQADSRMISCGSTLMAVEELPPAMLSNRVRMAR